MAEINLDEMRAVGEAATAEPWEVKPVCDSNGKPYATLYQTFAFVEPSVCGLWANEGRDLKDANFIAYARNHWTAIIAEIERLRKRVAELEKNNETLRHINKVNKEYIAEKPIVGAYHDSPADCPTYYNGCNCTVDCLAHNIERAEKAEKRIADLERQLEGEFNG